MKILSDNYLPEGDTADERSYVSIQDIFNGIETHTNNYNEETTFEYGKEAKDIATTVVLRCMNTQYFTTVKVGSPLALIYAGTVEQDALNLFRALANRKTLLQPMRFKGYLLDAYINTSIESRRIRLNTMDIFRDLKKKRKEYGIMVLSKTESTMSGLGFMYNLSYALGKIKEETYGRGMVMSNKVRASILDYIKKSVTKLTSTKDKVLYLEAPFLKSNESTVGTTLINGMMIKTFNINLIILEWLRDDKVGFTKWLTENNVTLVFSRGYAGAKMDLVIPPKRIIFESELFTVRNILRFLHILDRTDLTTVDGLTQTEIDAGEIVIDTASSMSASTKISETIISKMDKESNKESDRAEIIELAKAIGSGKKEKEVLMKTARRSDVVSNISDTMTTEIGSEPIPQHIDGIKINGNKAHNNRVEKNKLKSEFISRLMNDTDGETVGSTELLEIHNHSALTKYNETYEVMSLRKKMIEGNEINLEDVVDNITKHELEPFIFNNTVDNEFNKSSFMNLNKSYSEKIGKSELHNILQSPANGGSPYFLQSVTTKDISDSEFRGDLMKMVYHDANNNPIEVEIEVPSVEDGVMFEGGSTKYFTNQDLANVVIKVDDNVIITTTTKAILSLKGKYSTLRGRQTHHFVSNFIDAVRAKTGDKKNTRGITIKTTEALSEFIYENRVSYNLLSLNKFFGGVKIPSGDLVVDIDFRGKSVFKISPDDGDVFVTYMGYIISSAGEFVVLHSPESDKFYITEKKFFTIDENGIADMEDIELHDGFITEFIFTTQTLKLFNTVGSSNPFMKQERAESTSQFIEMLLNILDVEASSTAIVATSKSYSSTASNLVNSAYAAILNQDIPVVFVMLVETPLIELLKRLSAENGLEYKVVKTEELTNNISLVATYDYTFIQMMDFTIMLKYNNVLNQLILHPLTTMDLTGYQTFDIAYMLRNLVNNDNLSLYLESMVANFIDPGSKRVLEMSNIPSDFTGLWIYATSLFADHRTYYTSDARNYRLITPSEVMNRIIFTVINKEFTANTNKTKRGSRPSIKIPRDAVIRKIRETLNNVSVVSNTSPFRSIMLGGSKSQKGLAGINNERAYNMKRRMMTKTNLGTETVATPYSSNAGITKQLPFNPTFKDLTGRYNITDNADDLNTSNMCTFADAFIPYLTYDDPNRRLMTNGQMNHILPVIGADPMLVSYGADEAALFMAPVFSHIAELDGVVKTVNDKFIIMEYVSEEDGKPYTIPYRLDNIERNSAKGYYLKNDFIAAEGVVVGKKIKKGMPIAYNKDFYKSKSNGAVGLAAGPLTCALITDGPGTWEDAVVLSENLSRKLSTRLVKKISIKISAAKTLIQTSNLGIGTAVNSDTSLFKYDIITDDDSINTFFSDVASVNTKEITAHYKGVLNDINIYYRLKSGEEMHESVKRFISDVDIIQNGVNHMKSIADTSDQFRKVQASSNSKLLTRGKFSKINGEIVENGEVLIEFFIETLDKVGPADKVVVDRALKGEPTIVIPDEDRPYGSLTGRVADIMIDTQGINARKTPGIALHASLLAILLHIAIKNRQILGVETEPGTLLDYKSSYDIIDGVYK